MLRSALLCAVALFPLGCGKASPPEPRGTVTGQVTFRGQPVTGAMLHFAHQEKGHEAHVPLDADGKFVVKTLTADGLPPGKYRVTITPAVITEPTSDDPNSKIPPRTKTVSNVKIPAKYQAPATTDLLAEVVAGENPEFAFDLKP